MLKILEHAVSKKLTTCIIKFNTFGFNNIKPNIRHDTFLHVMINSQLLVMIQLKTKTYFFDASQWKIEFFHVMFYLCATDFKIRVHGDCLS